ncbi:Muscle LIM protein Mlp84B [Habropoda laboriosa]|uniref:Muscle LIM protein Mlp84B n=1 Tax=Habropoda laboriosa TaxID=597456 RepID=A0A0L7RAQ5_9HYME|nr:Muscle LIM protein Mlp84B [Habropoda laboriosa]
MPFKPVEHPKCPKCGKSVYAAEERVAGGLKWHKMCFKCARNQLGPPSVKLRVQRPARTRFASKNPDFVIQLEIGGPLNIHTWLPQSVEKEDEIGSSQKNRSLSVPGLCGKLLDSTNCTEHEGELFCKVCHGRKFGPKGYGFGGGAGCLSMDQGEHLKSSESGNSSFKECLKIYLKKWLEMISERSKIAWSIPRSFTLSTIFFLDRSDRSDLYKRHVFRELARGSNAILEPRAIAKAPEGEGCPRCGGYVYAAEQMLARGRQWHRECFKCANCSKRLDSVNCCEGPDKDIYCKVCYGKKFGPKGYGYGQGGGALQSDCYANGEAAPRTTVIDTAAIKAPPGKGCPRCGGVVFAAEQVLAKGREWHRKCYKCRDCTKTLDSIIACDGPDKDVYCKTCYGKKWGPHGYGFACGSGFLQTDGLTEEEISAGRPFYNPDTTAIKAPAGQGCPRCGGMVFAAEQQLAKGTMWHKKCFNCAECHRPLDSMLACDGPDKEIHCRSCYSKLFGPKGFGFGHTPTLVSTNGDHAPSYIDSKPQLGQKRDDGHGCARCGYPVYAAEQMISKNRVWHKRCFSCAECHRSLDSTNLNDAPDGDIYCRGCYNRNFGPKGVGFGMGAGTLTMA